MHSAARPSSPTDARTPPPRPPTASNLLGLDYRAEAVRMGPPAIPIIDAHCHVGGHGAVRIFDEARRAYGVDRVYSMTPLQQAQSVRDVMGDAVRFIAVPNWSDKDRGHAFRQGYLDHIQEFHDRFGSRMLKIWASPRFRELLPDGATDLWEIDAPWRVKACELGEKLGMMYMVHVADPDTWFATRYRDASKYGTKRHQYTALERMLDRFGAPWIGAHMGGWPEDLDFLDGLLDRHPNLHLDTSATKWMIRELSRHPRQRLIDFLTRWHGRILFGSDIVAQDDHLQPAKATTSPMADLADSPQSAFDLYASRYWALRTMWESAHSAPANIADPDLMMANPANHTAMSPAHLEGRSLPRELLESLYAGAARSVVERWNGDHP
ncbi:MAG: amidohydrolase family protein [Phycisphaerales bacterium]|nr:amidohydrolase family protein [Phycisphaerales bacterium]